jgi:hypothetical protein
LSSPPCSVVGSSCGGCSGTRGTSKFHVYRHSPSWSSSTSRKPAATAASFDLPKLSLPALWRKLLRLQ